MVAIPKIVGVISCGVLLCLGLSGNAVLAVDVMEAGQAGERIGGQAGREFEQGKQEHITATHAGERIGGQAGRGYAGVRIGGQAGRGYPQGKWEHVATQAGERIGGQAGLSEMGGMGK